ncbi:MAG: hypothetical protein LBV19_08640 [Streptococcaceae bacterium]|jgi:hypothetical protein|nr:hypothetical protein [Streptococcaceae bacterium]
MDLNEKELKLQERLAKLEKLEAEIKAREKSVKKKEQEKKQVLLRLSPTLWKQVATWSEEDFRSINSQIEFILTEAVKQHFGKKK